MPKQTIHSIAPIVVNCSDGWIHAMTSPDATFIDIELTACLRQINDDGSLSAQSVEIAIEYRPTGDSTWLQLATVRMEAAAMERTRRNIGMSVRKGQYEVRVRKITDDIKTCRASNEVRVGLRDARIDEQLVVDAMLDDLRCNGPFIRQLRGFLA